MRPVVERVGQMYRPDVALLPVSKWICHYKTGGVNAFCRYLDQEMLEQSFQYTAGPEDAADWAVLLGAPTVVPYATFTFVRGKVPPEVAQFAEELRRRGIGRRFYPMRPLDSLAVTDLGDGLARGHAAGGWWHGHGVSAGSIASAGAPAWAARIAICAASCTSNSQFREFVRVYTLKGRIRKC